MPAFSPLVIEALVATKPTAQVLKLLSVSGGPPGYLDKETIHMYLGIREVKSLKIFGDWLICDKIVVTRGEYRTVVSITDVQPLPADYQGLWNYSVLTGCLIAGSAEPSTRKGSGRIPYEHSKEFMIAPYTDEELSLINDYVLKTRSAPPNKPEFSVVKIGFILANIFAIVLFVSYLRKSRRS